ncbi:hypothetical protein [Aliikangiella coralliicola]|uniref:Uncharacterized protein n=1 Tax=Aliikangiella coralliicola TaxID=2592383 RepID=A0A545UBI8_9GAMM|nr:hypothetical protein [Aliikangiella coralliicola]TQV86825.1 hypothetical protein FLL46_13470 [Aliikangiella coralliicola]
MKQIMKVEDSFSTNEAGVIISGVNPEFDSLEPAEIKKYIGSKVRIVSNDGQELEANVRDVAISESLVGKKNISISLGEIKDVEKIGRGSIIYMNE